MDQPRKAVGLIEKPSQALLKKTLMYLVFEPFPSQERLGYAGLVPEAVAMATQP